MRKFLFLLAALPLTVLTGCMDDVKIDKEYQAVVPGLMIYTGISDQNVAAMEPVGLAVRFAMIAAEAAAQEAQINEVKFENRLLIDYLLGLGTRMEPAENGDYLLVFKDDQISGETTRREGRLRIKTNGRSLLSSTDESAPWELYLDSETFTLTVGSLTSVDRISYVYSGGTAKLYRSGDAYRLVPSGVKVYKGGGKDFEADWSGDFTLTPPDAGLRYADCADREFACSGNGHGLSYNTFNYNRMQTSARYEIRDGVYRSARLQTGEVLCTLLSNYDIEYYLVPNVEVIWEMAGKKQHYTVNYAGHSWSSR